MNQRWGRRLLVAGVAIAALSVPSGSAALWTQSRPAVTNQLQYGFLNLSPADPSCVFAPMDASHTLDDASVCALLPEYHGTVGDSVVVRFPLESSLAGDNLQAALRVVEGTGVGEGSVRAIGYRIVDPSLRTLEENSFRSFGDLSPFYVQRASVHAEIAVDVRLAWDGNALDYVDPRNPGPAPTSEAKQMGWTFVLEQVRS